MTAYTELHEMVLERIKPRPNEVKEVHDFSQMLLKMINDVLKKHGVDAKAEVHGSVAHGTWLSGERDIDVFIILQKKQDRNALSSVLNLLKKNIEGDYVEAYAEHPYLKASIRDYQVDLVPCFQIEEGMSLISSTDRTPLHTMYLKDRLDDRSKDEVRLLKQFFKGIGVYGAEIKVGGFSGYLCELLVLKYDSLISLIRAASTWKKYEVIQLGSRYDPNELIKKFKDPLIFIDPVDSNRNVASALSSDSFWNFVAAAQRFKDKPKLSYFFRKNFQPDLGTLINLINSRGTDILFLVVEEAKAEVPDSLWGQLLKSRQALEKMFTSNDFVVLRSDVWSNEKSRHIFIFELESAVIPEVELHTGPPVNMRVNSHTFINSHLDSEKTVSGPEIKDGRWAVLRKRQQNEVKCLLFEGLDDGGASIGISHNLTIKILQHHRILLNDEIREYLAGDFGEHLYRFLIGRPSWLE
jgi:tRNA nucleotidyltransferase (CCA-adding enzyme)